MPDTNPDAVKLLSDDEVAEIQTRNQYDSGLVISPEIDALCATVRALRAENFRLLNLVRYCRHELLDKKLITTEEFALLLEKGSAAHLETYDQLRTANTALREQLADLRAANLSNLLSEIKERLTAEEGEQFQALLMSATKGWVNEVTERSKVDRGLLEAFKDLPKRKKR